MHKIKNLTKPLRYLLEALATKIGLLVFNALGLKKSANLGSFLAKTIGKRISAHNLAKNNMAKALPNLSDEEIEGHLDDMWDNLGRIVGEFPHIANIKGKELISKYVSFDKKTLENLKNLRENHKGGIIFSGHIGNWEIGPKVLLEQGLNVKTVYRPLNNSLVDDMTASIRDVEMIPKSSKGNKQIINEIKNGNYVIILADQKISDGILVPFFHDKALTTTSIAKLALKYKVPIIPARSVRIGKEFKFTVDIGKPINANKDDIVNDDNVKNLTIKINQTLEKWITQYPAQWFWVHDRWKK
jgi:KDO2-lipid IV(A) lauroyltransferase